MPVVTSNKGVDFEVVRQGPEGAVVRIKGGNGAEFHLTPEDFQTKFPPKPVPPPETPAPVVAPSVEPSGTTPPFTGTRNAVTEAERAARGMEPVDRQAYTLMGDAYNTGREAVDAGRIDARSLAQAVAEKPRVLTTEEVGALGYDRAKLINEDKALLKSAETTDDPVELAAIRDRQAEIQRLFDLNDQALVKGGREQSAAFGARKMLIGEDYSLLEMKQKAKVAKGAPLTPQEDARIEQLSKDLEAAQSRISELESQRNIERVIRDAAREEGLQKRRSIRRATKEQIQKEYNDLINEFVAKTSKLSAGIDPELFPLVGRIARNRVQAGITTAQGLVDELYTALAPHIEGLTLRDVRDAISGYGQVPKEASPEAKKLSQLRTTMRLISSIEDAEANKRPFKGKAPVVTEETKRMREDLRSLMKQQGLEEPRPPATRTGLRISKPPSDEQLLKTAKTRVNKAIHDLQAKLATEDISKKPARQMPSDPELVRAQAQVSMLRDAYSEMVRTLSPRTPGEKIVSALNIPRALRTSFDISYAGRQGLIASMSHPAIAAKAFVAQLHAMKSPHAYYEIMAEIRSRPNYELYKRSGLSLTEAGHHLAGREEPFMTEYAEKLPLGIGRGVAASERGFVTMQNRLRADVFDAVTSAWSKSMEPTDAQYRSLATLINDLTGRGDLGPLNKFAPALSAGMFAPRFVASRIRLLNPARYIMSPPGVRRELITSMAKYVGAGLALMQFAKMRGAQVEDDPRSSDFGKIRFGNTRYDIWGGEQQYVRFFSQMARGETKSLRSGQIQSLSSPKYGQPSRLEHAERFLRGKAAPVPSYFMDMMAGKNVVGEPFDVRDTWRQFLPMWIEDVNDAIREQGPENGTLMALPSLLGVGVQSFNAQAPPQGTQSKSTGGKIKVSKGLR